jgi:hypothetical protein
MDKPLISTTSVLPLFIQTYERYLPSAFDDSMSILEKVNKALITLNQIGKVSNDVIDSWNQVMEWVLNDGLNASIDEKLNAMEADGTLATIINQDIFTMLNNEVNQNTTDIATNTANITKNTNDLASLSDSLTTNVATLNDSIQTTKTNLENELTVKAYKVYGTPEEFGAKGDYYLPDGSINPNPTDDTTAIQACLNACNVTEFNSTGYLISTTLVLPENHSIEGNHALLIVKNNWVNGSNGANVPTGTMLFVKPRQPVFDSQLDMVTRFVRDLRLQGSYTFQLTGIFAGVPDISVINQSSSVNYGVFGCEFSNISLSYLYDGLSLGEVWESQFTHIVTGHIKNMALKIIGQSVNNTFTGCLFGTQGEGNYGLYMDGNTYNGSIWQPEGNMFIGGFIGEASIGVRIERGLAIKFSNVIIDLNVTNAVVGTNMNDIVFEGCYLYCTNNTIGISGVFTNVNGSFIAFKNCNIITVNAAYAVYINQNQNGIILDGCQISKKVYFDSGASGIVTNCFWNEASDSNARIEKHGTGIVKSINNTFKYDGSDLPAIAVV